MGPQRLAGSRQTIFLTNRANISDVPFSISNALRVAASEALVELALPQFLKWLRGILALPVESPALHETLYFNAAYTEKGLVVSDQPKYKRRRRKQK